MIVREYDRYGVRRLRSCHRAIRRRFRLPYLLRDALPVPHYLRHDVCTGDRIIDDP